MSATITGRPPSDARHAPPGNAAPTIEVSGNEAPVNEAPRTPARASHLPDAIYVLGYGRSGSTLLDILLGNASGIESVGELDLLHRDWNTRVCSCGEAYEACPFWASIDRRVQAALGPRTRAALDATLRRVEDLGALPALALGWLPRRARREYREQLRALWAAIASVDGCDTILDSSKSAREAAGRALALGRVAGLRVRGIHLVRDGRAVLWSVRRGDNVRLGAGAKDDDAQYRAPALRAVLGWMLANVIALVTERLSPRGSILRVHYERLVSQPDEELARIAAFLGRDLDDVRRRVRDGEALPVGHNTGGNRLRQGGAVRVRSDEEWRTRLSRRDRVLFWALAWPLALALAPPRR
jgi:hypothetical protein